ncbi:hypothetical protein Tco_1238419 [Tanacetum coccineum]
MIAILRRINRCSYGKGSNWAPLGSNTLDIMGIVYSANLDFASLIWDEFEWQTVKRSSRPSKMSKLLYTHFTKLIIDYLLSLNKSIPRRSDSKFHSSQDDHPITKLLKMTNSDYKFGMEVPDAMISDAIKKKAGYTYYMAKKVEGEKAKIIDKPEEQHISPIKNGRGKGFMCYGDQVANVPNKLKKDAMPWKTISLTIAKEAVVEENAKETDDADKSDMDLPDDNPHGDDDDARNVPRRECSSYSISTSKENSLSYNNAPTKLPTSQSKEADANAKNTRKVRHQEGSHKKFKEL